LMRKIKGVQKKLIQMNMNLNTPVLNVGFNTMTNPYAWFLSDLDNIPKNGLNVFSTFACGGGYGI